MLIKYGVINTSKLDFIKNKVKQTNLEKYGVEFPMQLEEFQNRIKQTSIKKYGVYHFTQAPEVIQKRKATNLAKYGVEFPIQNKAILNKSIMSRYQHGNFTCSKQQYYLYQLIGGELNYPFLNFIIDIAFPVEKIAVEWDDSGHDLSVRMGKVTPNDFKRNENYRSKILFENNWRIIRFITKHDIMPLNITQLFDFCRDYIKSGGHYIIVYIDEKKVSYKNVQIDFSEIF